MATYSVIAPMTGKVIEILVARGDSVEVGDMLLVVESMKMENEIIAEVSGTIVDINVRDAGTVGEGDILIVIER